jgi:hypothetical protein
VLWVITSEPSNGRFAVDPRELGIAVPLDVLALVTCEWRVRGDAWALVTTRDARRLMAEPFELLGGQVTGQEAALIEAALSEVVS